MFKHPVVRFIIFVVLLRGIIVNVKAMSTPSPEMQALEEFERSWERDRCKIAVTAPECQKGGE